jgi:orotate phosphoribosyltransferase
MRTEEVIQKFKRLGALLEGHFLLSSGLHSSAFLQCAIALQSTADAVEFGLALAGHYKNESIETVASPAIGGLVIGYEVARQLGVRFIWTERSQGQMSLRRGFSVANGERVLVVEDVITTGGSTRDTIAALRAAGPTWLPPLRLSTARWCGRRAYPESRWHWDVPAVTAELVRPVSSENP